MGEDISKDKQKFFYDFNLRGQKICYQINIKYR